MSDHIDASTQHGAGDSPDTTAPTKHSLRALEPASSGPSTREEDLTNGPLLLALGDGIEEPVISHPEFYLASQYSDHHRPEESVIPSIPLRLPEALDMGPMTSSAMSQSGPSLSVPTESIPGTSHPPRSLTEDILGISQPLLLPIEDILSANRSLPLPASQALNDIKSLLAELNDRLVIRDRGVFPFSRSCEFSWRDSGLPFGGEPFEVTRTPNDAFSVVNAGSSYASSQSCSSSDTMDSDTTAEPSDPKRLIAMYSYADWVVELLIDDLYRSCAPQASNRRTTGALKKVSEGASNNPEGQKKGFNGKARSRKRKALGGDGESEDEDPQDKKRKSSDIGKDEKRWACPFVKWDPEEYRCNISPTQIRGVRNHIKKVHWQEHCDRCWSYYSTSEEEEAHQACQRRPPSNRPPGLITKETLEILSQRASSSLTHEEQWFGLYRVLFPGEQLGFSPYVNKATCDFMDRAEVRFRSPRSREILEEVGSKFGFKGAEDKQFVDIICDEYLRRMFQEHELNNERLCKAISHDQQVVDNDQLSQIDVAGTSKAITEREPQYQASPLSLGETSIPHQFPEFKLEDSPMFDLQTPAGEIILGDDTSSDLLNLAGFEDPLDGVDSRELEGCSQEMLGGVLPDTFDNALYGNLDTDENYLGFTAGIDWSGT